MNTTTPLYGQKLARSTDESVYLLPSLSSSSSLPTSAASAQNMPNVTVNHQSCDYTSYNSIMNPKAAVRALGPHEDKVPLSHVSPEGLTDMYCEVEELVDEDEDGLAEISSPMKHVFPKFVSPHKDMLLASPSQFLHSPDRLVRRDESTQNVSLRIPRQKNQASAHNQRLLLPSTPPKYPWKMQVPKTPTQILQEKIDSQPGSDSFLTFVHTLSPLVEIKNIDRNSPLGIRLSPCPPSKTSGHASSAFRQMVPERSTPGGICSATSSARKTPRAIKAVAQKLDFGCDASSCAAKIKTSLKNHPQTPTNFPHIKTITSATPGSEQRSLGKRSYMLHILNPGESICSGEEIKTINANLNRDCFALPTTQNFQQGNNIQTQAVSLNSPGGRSLPMSGTTTNQFESPALTHQVKRPKSTASKRKRKAKATIAPPELETPRKRNPCNCKKSQCLKLYCDCFANGGFCDEHCNCENCANTKTSGLIRQQAIDSILERNPNAFQPKIQSTTSEKMKNKKQRPVHLTGCRCKKSGCLKKYCECFLNGIVCGDKCKCTGCKNCLGNKERAAILATPKPLNKSLYFQTKATTPQATQNIPSKTKCTSGKSPKAPPRTDPSDHTPLTAAKLSFNSLNWNESPSTITKKSRVEWSLNSLPEEGENLLPRLSSPIITGKQWSALAKKAQSKILDFLDARDLARARLVSVAWSDMICEDTRRAVFSTNVS